MIPSPSFQGTANHRRSYGVLIEHVLSDLLDPARLLTQTAPMTGAVEANKAFDARQLDRMRVELMPAD